MQNAYASFEEFWSDYVLAHQNKMNRTLHAVGVGLALACVVAAIFRKRPSLLALAPVLAYGFAWCGHFFVEKNTPATFSHPVHSARAGLLLFWKTISSEMDAEVARVLEEVARRGTSANRDVAAEAVN